MTNATDLRRLTRQGPAPETGIVHLGPGAFFRAFNAVYTHDAMEAGGGDWGITAVSLRSPTARDQLDPQGGVFTSVSLSPEAREATVIGSIARVLVAPDDPGAVIDAMSHPGVKIVSLTITEKGYCHEPATGALRMDHPDIAHDIANPTSPRSAPGFIVAALGRRRAAGTPPFTVLSCDNLPSNGALAKRIIVEFARAQAPDLAEWIEEHVPFPATMVDRITPATTEADIAALAEDRGYYDPACVVHEPFRQWVIEDDFAGPRPAWERAGAQFVRSVEAHETMKLRCLNGTHSALAYLGFLAGHQTIAEATGDPAFAALCRKLWADEILPTVETPEGEDTAAYCARLLDRYRNPSIRHRTWQIAMDGSQKLPQRILGTISDRLAAGQVPPGLCLVVAGWMRYVGAVDEKGHEIDVRDPLAGRLKAAWDQGEDAAGKVNAFLELGEVFERGLAGNAAFRDEVTSALATLLDEGAKSAVEAYSA